MIETPKDPKKVLIAAGGTGGHLFPAQDLAKELREKGVNVSFAGKSLSTNPYFQKEHFRFYEISSAMIKKTGAWGWIKTFFSLTKGLFQSIKILQKEKPDLVIGFGSYHSFPVLLACRLLKKSYFLYERNCLLGKVNRFFAKKAKRLAIQFPLINYKENNNVCFVKTPSIKKTIPASLEFSLDHRFTFLVFGGSQGAAKINEAFFSIAKALKKKRYDFQVIHITGHTSISWKKRYDQEDIFSHVVPFTYQMPLYYSKSNAVICRSGAGAVHELIEYKKPAVLIPYPYASEDHQRLNAEFFQQVVKGGEMVLQKDLESPKFFEAVEKLILNNENFYSSIANYIKEEETKEKSTLMETVWSTL